MNYLPVPFDAKALSEPAKLLIEKFATGFGVLYEPRRIRNEAAANADATRLKAQADADALEIRTRGEIKVTDLQRRAFARWLKQEERYQENLEAIEQEAVQILEDRSETAKAADAPNQGPSEEWLDELFEGGKSASDETARNRWAKILAGEFAAPGSFSKRTLVLMRSLEPLDARLFNQVACLAWKIEGKPVPLIYQFDVLPMFVAGVRFDELAHLASLALITFESIGEHTLSYGATVQNIVLEYQGRKFTIETPLQQFNTGKVGFTRSGLELFQLCEVAPVQGYVEYIQKRFEDKMKLKLTEGDLGPMSVVGPAKANA